RNLIVTGVQTCALPISTGDALASTTGRVSREVQASLELAPMPWQGTGGLKHDDYWRLPEGERKAREEKLRSLPAQWAGDPAPVRSEERRVGKTSIARAQ